MNIRQSSSNQNWKCKKGPLVGIQSFMQDVHGNFAMMFALMGSVLFLFVGAAVDYVRANGVRSDILDSLDAASLAIARMEDVHEGWTDDQLIEYGEKIFIENSASVRALLRSDHAPFTNIDEIISFDLVSDEKKIHACVDGSVATYLLAVVGTKHLDIKQCVSITKPSSRRIELALVLDVTGSMSSLGYGEAKIDSLKQSVVSMLDIMFGTETRSNKIKIGVVPFNMFVNPGGASSWDPSWGDQNAQALYHGARFIHVDQVGRIDANRKVNHYALYDSDPDSSWTGCVESRPYPLDELDTPPGTTTNANTLSAAIAPPSSADEADTTMRAAFDAAPSIHPSLSLSQLGTPANSRFVPLFLGDGPDCVSLGILFFCSEENGDPQWEQTETVHMNGADPTITFARNWFTTPNAAGFGEAGYLLNQYIDDELYIGRYAGQPASYYAYILEQFRALESSNGSYTPAQQGFRDYMIGLGVGNNRFADPSVANAFDTGRPNYDEYILRGAYVGWWDPVSRTYKHKYDLPKSNTLYPPSHRRCPPPILPLTDDRLLIDGGDADGDGMPDGGAIANLIPQGSTSVTNGAMWGWRVVSDAPPFTESIGPNDTGPDGTIESDWQRAVVLMTDGENSVSYSASHFGSEFTTYGYASEERLGVGIDSANSGGTNGNMLDEVDNKLLRICRRMKQEDILVYTIVFDVAAGSNIDKRMKSCASHPTEPYYVNAPTPSELRAAFEGIAENLTRLHVSQ